MWSRLWPTSRGIFLFSTITKSITKANKSMEIRKIVKDFEADEILINGEGLIAIS